MAKIQRYYWDGTKWEPEEHTHNTSDITEGTLGVARGGTGLSTVTSNSYLKGSGTGALVPRTYTQVKNDLALNNVENKTSATIRGEITSANVTSALGFTPAPSSHNHAISQITGLQNALDGKAASSHTHGISDITNLQTTLNSKANASHTHAISQITGLQTELDGKLKLDGSLPMTGDLDMGAKAIENVSSISGTDGGNLSFDGDTLNYSYSGGDVVLGKRGLYPELNMDEGFITNLRTPTLSSDAATKDYVDGKEPAFSKNTAFNKNFAGTGSATTVSRSDHNHDSTYLKSYTETDPTVPAHVKSITQAKINEWNGGSTSDGIAIKGKNTVGYGLTTDLTPSEVKTMLNVQQTWELIKSRAAGSSLTSVSSGTTAGSITLDTGKTVAAGTTIMMEVSNTSTGSANNTKVVIFTLQKTTTTGSTNATVVNWHASHSTSVGTYTKREYAFVPYRNAGNVIGFGNKFTLTGSFSGSTITWTNTAYTLYVGRIWRLVE